MLLIKTEVKPSQIHGLGLFAVERIPIGTEVFRLVRGFDWRCSIGEIDDSIPEVFLDFLWRFGWRHEGAWYVCLDDARYVNHSESPSLVVAVEDGVIVSRARRDIAAGEELTENYREFDTDFDKYGASWK